jgi:hypothetical protein
VIELPRSNEPVSRFKATQVVLNHCKSANGGLGRRAEFGQLESHDRDPLRLQMGREPEHEFHRVASVHLHVVDDGGEALLSRGVVLDSGSYVADLALGAKAPVQVGRVNRIHAKASIGENAGPASRRGADIEGEPEAREPEVENTFSLQKLEFGAADLVVVAFEAVAAARPCASVLGSERHTDVRPLRRAQDGNDLLGIAAVHRRSRQLLQRLGQGLIEDNLSKRELALAENPRLNRKAQVPADTGSELWRQGGDGREVFGVAAELKLVFDRGKVTDEDCAGGFDALREGSEVKISFDEEDAALNRVSGV